MAINPQQCAIRDLFARTLRLIRYRQVENGDNGKPGMASRYPRAIGSCRSRSARVFSMES